MTTERRLRLHQDVNIVDNERGAVLLDLRAGGYWQVTSTAAVVLHGLAEGSTESALVRLLSDRFTVGVDEATADVRAFTSRLADIGLLVREKS